MKKASLFALALTIALSASSVDAKDVSPAAIAPVDAAFCVHLIDVTKMEAAWKKTGVSRLWSDDQMRRFTKPLRDWAGMKIGALKANAAATGADAPGDSLTWAQFKDYFPGGFALWLSDITFINSRPQGGSITIAAKANPKKTRKDYEEFLAKHYNDMPEPGAKKRSFKVGGVTVYETEKKLPEEYIAQLAAVAPDAVASARTSAIQVAMMDGWILMTDGSANTLRDMILRHTGKRNDSLASTANYRSAMRRAVDTPQIGVYLNIEPVIAGALTSLRASGAIDPTRLNIDALHLEDIKSVAYVAGFNEKAIEQSLKIALAKEPRGIAKIIKSLATPCSFKSATLTPKDVTSYSASGMRLGTLVTDILNLVKAVSPSAGPEIEQALTSVRMTAGFDPLTEIIQQIDGEIAYASVAKPTPGVEATDDVFMLECKDGARVEAAFKKIEQMILAQQAQTGGVPESPFESSQFLGFTLYTIKLQPNAGMMMMGPQPTAHWVFGKSWIVISTSSDLLKQTLRRMAQRDAGAFAEAPVLKRVRSQNSSGLCGMSYTNLAEELLLLCLQGQQIAPLASMMTQGAIPANILDFSAMPDKALFETYLGDAISVTLSEPDGLLFLETIESP